MACHLLTEQPQVQVFPVLVFLKVCSVSAVVHSEANVWLQLSLCVPSQRLQSSSLLPSPLHPHTQLGNYSKIKVISETIKINTRN